MIKEAFQDLNRLRQIGVIAAKHGFADWLERAGVWGILGKKESVEITPEKRRESQARRFTSMLNELGPTFIKLGQVLSTRADLLPAEYIEELATLQDHVRPITLEQVNEAIRSSLGKEPSQLFQSICPDPLAAASIAQVHRAVTLSGEEVVIKVQRPGIAEQIRSDVSVLLSLARMLEAVVEETGVYTPTGIVEEFDRAIHEELDFVNEAVNIKDFHKHNDSRGYMKIPKVFDALSSRTVLTMEFLQGTKISQIDLKKHDRDVISRNLVDVSFRMLFEDGLFHGDPHPGNILVLENDVIALLDFGVVGRLSKPMQDTMVMLVLSIALKDSDSVARTLYRLGSSNSRANLMGFKTDIDAILTAYLPGADSTLGSISAKTLLRDILDLAVKYKIRIPKEYAILSRASVSMEGVLRSLNPDLKVMEIVLPYAKDLLTGRYDPNQLQGGMLRTLLRVQGLANDLPVQLSQLMLDLEAGKFTVTVHSEQIDKLNSNLRAMAMVAFSGLCACGMIVGMFIAFAQQPQQWTTHGIPVLGLVGLTGAAALFGSVFTWYLFGGSIRKVKLSNFLKRDSRRLVR
ncbi:MAG: ABC1 kinase family protein [Myxococcaceae bacterium]